MPQDNQTDSEKPMDVSVEPHPITGETQVVIYLGSGVRARMGIRAASQLQDRLTVAIGFAQQDKFCTITAAKPSG